MISVQVPPDDGLSVTAVLCGTVLALSGAPLLAAAVFVMAVWFSTL
ncbi:hypothetical protein [Salinilacihabitans rarus]|nr:hypothetical protein [Salinilacihabitans rarus]